MPRQEQETAPRSSRAAVRQGVQGLRAHAGDLLICAGDIELRNTRDWQYFLAFLSRQPHANKVVSFGNMDGWTEDLGKMSL